MSSEQTCWHDPKNYQLLVGETAEDSGEHEPKCVVCGSCGKNWSIGKVLVISDLEAENRRLKEELEAQWEESGRAARLNAELQAQLAQAQARAEAFRAAPRRVIDRRQKAEGELLDKIDALRTRAELADEIVPWLRLNNMAPGNTPRFSGWLARYDALSSPTPGPEGVTE